MYRPQLKTTLLLKKSANHHLTMQGSVCKNCSYVQSTVKWRAIKPGLPVSFLFGRFLFHVPKRVM